MSKDIATTAGKRYVHICECRRHKTCGFTSESLKSVVEVCNGNGCRGSGCDSVRSYSYNPHSFDLDDMRPKVREALIENYKGSDYLQQFSDLYEQVEQRI